MRTDYQQLKYLDKTLRKLLKWVEDRYGFEFTETSSYRMDNDGVHGTLPCRGYDLRCWDHTIGRMICAQINDVWSYDHIRPNKECAIYHDTGSGFHIHLQTHENTRRNK